MSTDAPSAPYVSWGSVLVRPEVAQRVAGADTFIFDIDGVLVDVSASLGTVGCDAVHFYLTQLLGWTDTGPFLQPQDLQLFQLADGFNDDWQLAGVNVLLLLVKAELGGTHDAATLRQTSPTIAEVSAAARESRGGADCVRDMLLDLLGDAGRRRVERAWDYQKIVQVFQEMYAGEDHCVAFYGYHPQFVHVPGRIALDRPLIRRQSVPATVTKLGVYSGRTWEEANHALTTAGISDLFTRERVMVLDDGPAKPDPRGLATLLKRMGSSAAVFVGDMPDDREAARRYQAECRAGAEVFDCLVLSGPLGERPEPEIRAAGADLIAPDVNVLLEWWATLPAGIRQEIPPATA